MPKLKAKIVENLNIFELNSKMEKDLLRNILGNVALRWRRKF
jgi:hypothetical protein